MAQELVDVKEPARGSLGAATAQHWAAVRAECPPEIPISVALGELLDPELADRLAALPPVSFAKIGLAHCRCREAWQQRWRWAIGQLPQGTAAVAVIYADAASAAAPDATQIIALGQRLGCRGVLWDTCGKDRGRLFAHVTQQDLAEQIQLARAAGLFVVLAGSLTVADLPAIALLAPDIVAVRGAVCEPDRSGMLCGQRVQQLATALARLAPSPA